MMSCGARFNSRVVLCCGGSGGLCLLVLWMSGWVWRCWHVCCVSWVSVRTLLCRALGTSGQTHARASYTHANTAYIYHLHIHSHRSRTHQLHIYTHRYVLFEA